MARLYRLIDRESWRPFAVPVFVGGAALAISSPVAGTLRDLAGGSLYPALPAFLILHAVSMNLLGLALGAASVERGETGERLLLALILRVGLAETLCLPYLAFSLALSPGRFSSLALVALWTVVTTLAFAVVSRLIEASARRATSRTFVAKYAVFIGYCVLPLLGLPILSPLAAPRLLFDGAPLAHVAATFGAPLALLAAATSFVLRARGEARA